MNYHIMIDDKFIDGFIDDMEAVDPNKSKYVFTFEQPGKYVRSTKGVFAPYGSHSLQQIKKGIGPGDKVFVHWLSDDAADFILSLPDEIEVGAVFWGGDFVEEPLTFHKDRILGPRSLELYNSEFECPIQLSWSPAKLAKAISYKYWKFRRVQGERHRLKQQAVQRLDCILNWNPVDHAEVEELYDTNTRYLYFYYDVGLDKEIVPLRNPYIARGERTTVWLGNSSSITNNHLEAIESLAHHRHRKIDIKCPLSYGDRRYASIIQQAGEHVFGSKFVALDNFIKREQFYTMLDRVDLAIMNHQRTQAAGTVRALLTMGKKIYLNPASTLYQFLRESGIEVFEFPGTAIDYDSFLKPLGPEVARRNFEILQKLFSEDRKRKTLENL